MPFASAASCAQLAALANGTVGRLGYSLRAPERSDVARGVVFRSGGGGAGSGTAAATQEEPSAQLVNELLTLGRDRLDT